MAEQPPIHIGVGVVVIKDDKVLLIKRGKEPRKGMWSIPGGHLELGETAQAGARRELMEETNLKVGPLFLADVVDSIKTEPGGVVKSQYLLVDYWARFEGGEAREGGDADAVKWVGRAEIGSYVEWGETKRVLELAFDASQTQNED